MSKRSILRAVVLLTAGSHLYACGGPDTSGAATEEQSADTAGSEEAAEREDGVAISGLMGTIRREQVEDTLNPRLPRFARCIQQRMGDVEVLSGEIRMSFRIHADGSVAWVYPSATDLGDRASEQCVLELARGARFPRPRGGEAEFSWSFGLDAAEDVRPPLNWSEDALGSRQNDLSGLGRECQAGGAFSVTAYIEPGGRVIAAGGSMPSADHEGALECILERVRAWEMPDPGSYPAKITFAVQ